jgi:hypothetical protein
MRTFLPQWKHIVDIDQTESVYLSRLMLARTRLFGVYLHVIRRPDWSTCQHDHPWSFATLILWGGYEERVGDRTYVRRPGYFGYRPRRFEHRITRLLRGKAITIVFRGPNHEEWGFRTAAGKVSWREYMTWTTSLRVLWCDDAPRGGPSV